MEKIKTKEGSLEQKEASLPSTKPKLPPKLFGATSHPLRTKFPSPEEIITEGVKKLQTGPSEASILEGHVRT